MDCAGERPLRQLNCATSRQPRRSASLTPATSAVRHSPLPPSRIWRSDANSSPRAYGACLFLDRACNPLTFPRYLTEGSATPPCGTSGGRILNSPSVYGVRDIRRDAPARRLGALRSPWMCTAIARPLPRPAPTATRITSSRGRPVGLLQRSGQQVRASETRVCPRRCSKLLPRGPETKCIGVVLGRPVSARCVTAAYGPRG